MAGLGKKQGVCIDIPLRRVEAFSEVVSEQVVERIGPVYKLLLLLLLLLLNLIVSKKKLLLEGAKVDPPIPLQSGMHLLQK